MFASLLSALLVGHAIANGYEEECPLPRVPPLHIKHCSSVDALIMDKGIDLDPLSEFAKEYFEDVKVPPKQIGSINGVMTKVTHIYVTSTNGARSGDCTDKTKPCAIDYVFGISGIGVSDYTAVHFDPTPITPYPKMRLLIRNYVWLLGNGLVLDDTLQFEFSFCDESLICGQKVAVSIRDFTFCNYNVPSIHCKIDRMTISERGSFELDVRNCNFLKSHSRCVEVFLDSKNTVESLNEECEGQFISINIVCCNFDCCSRCGTLYDTIGGFVIVDNHNNHVPVLSSVMYSNFTNNCLYANCKEVCYMGGCAFAGLNLYSFGCCSSKFTNNTCSLPCGDLYGAALYIYNCPLRICKYSVIAYSYFNGNSLIHSDKLACYGSGAAIFLNGQFCPIIFNDEFDSNIISGVQIASGIDVSAIDCIHFIICGCSFNQKIIPCTSSEGCEKIPSFIGGGSIFYDPCVSPFIRSKIIQFSITCCNFSGPLSNYGNPCPGAPPQCSGLVWIYGGAILTVNDIEDAILNINITNDCFMRCSGDVGGAILISSKPPKKEDEVRCIFEEPRSFVTIESVHFINCIAGLYGGSAVISAAVEKNRGGSCDSCCKLFNVKIIGVVSQDNCYPTSSFVISASRLFISNFVAFNNEAGRGVFFLSNCNINIEKTLNITHTTCFYVEPSVPSIGGIYVSGQYSSLTFLTRAKVFINAHGSEIVKHGWGLYFGLTASKIPVISFARNGAIVVNRVESNGNFNLNLLTITKDTPGNPCALKGLYACSSTDSSIRCINFCTCQYGGDPYCGECNPFILPPPQVPPFTRSYSTPDNVIQSSSDLPTSSVHMSDSYSSNTIQMSQTSISYSLKATYSSIFSTSTIITSSNSPVIIPTILSGSHITSSVSNSVSVSGATRSFDSSPIGTSSYSQSGITSASDSPLQTTPASITSVILTNSFTQVDSSTTLVPLNEYSSSASLTSTAQSSSQSIVDNASETTRSTSITSDQTTVAETPSASSLPSPSSSPSPSPSSSSSSISDVSITISLMTDNTYSKASSSNSYGYNEEAYILVQTPLTGGQLIFSSLTVTNVQNYTGASGQYKVEIPAENLTNLYWSGKSNCFGISLNMFSWPQAVSSSPVFIHINVLYNVASASSIIDTSSVSGESSIEVMYKGSTSATTSGGARNYSPGTLLLSFALGFSAVLAFFLWD